MDGALADGVDRAGRGMELRNAAGGRSMKLGLSRGMFLSGSMCLWWRRIRGVGVCDWGGVLSSDVMARHCEGWRYGRTQRDICMCDIVMFLRRV